MLSEIKRKTLPTIAKAMGGDAQALHHFVANAPWSVQELRARRLALVHQALKGRPFILCIDETGDRKKGHTTDYVSHQYIGNLGKLENGIVSVNASDILDQITFPLLFKVFKPRTRLKPGDSYKTKSELAVEITKELRALGLRASAWCWQTACTGKAVILWERLPNLHLTCVVAICSNHGVWLPPGQRVRYTNWRPFERVFSNGKQQTR
jgi:SRSO17 transposase